MKKSWRVHVFEAKPKGKLWRYCPQKEDNIELLLHRCLGEVLGSVGSLYQGHNKITLRQVFQRSSFIGSKTNFPFMSWPLKNEAWPCLPSPDSCPPLRVHSDQPLAMPTQWIYVGLWLGLVCWLYPFLIFLLFLCPLSIYSSASDFTPLVLKWSHQNENLSGSTLLSKHQTEQLTCVACTLGIPSSRPTGNNEKKQGPWNESYIQSY